MKDLLTNFIASSVQLNTWYEYTSDAHGADYSLRQRLNLSAPDYYWFWQLFSLAFKNEINLGGREDDLVRDIMTWPHGTYGPSKAKCRWIRFSGDLPASDETDTAS